MSKSIQQLEKDLADLERQVSQLAETFYEKYQRYLDLLSQTTRQQLILASYQICTQINPDNFLKLPLSVQQSLQEQIRHYANSIKKRIISALDSSYQEQSSSLDSEIGLNTVEEILKNIKTPDELLNWAKNIERTIGQILDNYSHLLNQCFTETGILPKNLPPKLLEMAIKTQEVGSPITGSTNLLQVFIGGEESEQEDLELEEVKEPKIKSIVIVHLKLAELEFGNLPLGLEHEQIRSLYERLKYLSQLYQQKQKDLAIARATVAWRSLWYDS